MCHRTVRCLYGLALGSLGVGAPLFAQQAARTTTNTIGAGLFVILGDAGNLIIRVGGKQSQVVGIQAPALTVRARALLDSLHAPPVAFAVSAVTDSVVFYGDGGWGSTGATTIGHENVRYMPYYRQVVSGPSAPRRPTDASPVLGFSEAMQILVFGEEEIHLVHQKPGFSDADIIAHFERAKVLYLGRVLATDGYPEITTRFGGSISGMIGTVEYFNKYMPPDTRFVPGRGPVVGLDGLGKYLTMLTTVRDTVRALITRGMTLKQIVASHPTAPTDAIWGKGPIGPAAFTAAMYSAIVHEDSVAAKAQR
jgi:hypothetical protein